jgi:hypothetical protein
MIAQTLPTTCAMNAYRARSSEGASFVHMLPAFVGRTHAFLSDGWKGLSRFRASENLPIGGVVTRELLK